MKFTIQFMFVLILSVIGKSQAAISDDLRECTNDNFLLGVVECFASKFEGLLPIMPRTPVHNDEASSLEGFSFKHHEPSDNFIRYNFIMPSISQRMTTSHHQMLDKLHDIVQAVINQELEVLAIEKLKHVNFQDIIYEYIAEIMHQIAPQMRHHLSQFMTFAESSQEDPMDDACRPFCLVPSPLCDACQQVTNDLPNLVSCLQEFSPEDFEDNLRWTKCLVNCEDLIPISSCMTDHFSQCGQLSILSDLIIRGFADYTGLSDTCLVNVMEPENLTLAEGGGPTNVEFYTYMPPGAMCIDFKGLSEPLGMLRALGTALGLALGNSPECTVQIQMSMQNFWDNLIPHVDSNLLPIGIGRPKCHDKSAIRQAVLGNHEWASGMETCIINVTMDNWNSSHSVPIWPSIDLKKDGDVNTTFTLKLMVNGAVTYNKKIPIMVEDKDLNQKVSLCQSTGDPHIITFDGHYYNNLYDGYFYLYKHKELPYQIQVIYQRCIPGGNASCTCGVSIMSGDDVFSVSKCRQTGGSQDPLLQTVLYVNGNLTAGTRVFRKDQGSRFEVILPTGARADIVVYQGFLNVYFTPSTYDLELTEGLCGVYDGDDTNDLTMPDGSVYTGPGNNPREQPRDFSKAWRVPEGDRILTGTVADHTLDEGSAPYCLCNHVMLRGVQCTCGGGELTETCDIGLDGEITDNLPALMRKSQKSLLKTRDIETEDIDIDESFEPPNITFENNQVWNQTRAEEWCEKFIQDDSFVSSECPSTGINAVLDPVHIQMAEWHCEEDIAITDSNAWQYAATESVTKSCINSLQSMIDMENDTYIAIEDQCVNRCNGRGTCSDGVCECDPPYTGGDCSLMGGDPPVVEMDSSSKCDKRHEDCQYATVYGRHFPADNSLKCRVQEAQVDREAGTFYTSGDEVEVDIMYISPYQVVCYLPASHSYQVTLEQAGSPLSVAHQSPQPYATSFVFMAYDSACYSCDVNTQSCQEKESSDHCIIEEACYASGEVNPGETCQYCNGTQDMQEWVWFSDEECQKKKDELLKEDEKAQRDLIIRISVACILTALIVLLTVILYLRSKKKAKPLDEEDLDEFDTTDSPQKKPKLEEKSTEGVTNEAFDKTEEGQNSDTSSLPLKSPRLKEVQKLDPVPKAPSSSREKQLAEAKQAAIQGRSQRGRSSSTSSTTSNRSLGIGAGSSLQFSQYHHLAGGNQEEAGFSSSLDKGIGAHATPPLSKRNIHSGVSNVTYF